MFCKNYNLFAVSGYSVSKIKHAVDVVSFKAYEVGRYHLVPQETHTLCVFDRLPVVSWRRAKYKQMYGLKSTLTVSR